MSIMDRLQDYGRSPESCCPVGAPSLLAVPRGSEALLRLFPFRFPALASFLSLFRVRRLFRFPLLFFLLLFFLFCGTGSLAAQDSLPRFRPPQGEDGENRPGESQSRLPGAEAAVFSLPFVAPLQGPNGKKILLPETYHPDSVERQLFQLVSDVLKPSLAANRVEVMNYLTGPFASDMSDLLGQQARFLATVQEMRFLELKIEEIPGIASFARCELILFGEPTSMRVSVYIERGGEGPQGVQNSQPGPASAAIAGSPGAGVWLVSDLIFSGL